jgi:hypothetical protein
MVYDVGDKWENLAVLERMVDFPTAVAAADSKDPTRGWTRPDERDRNRTLDGMGRNYSSGTVSYTTPSGQVVTTTPGQPPAVSGGGGLQPAPNKPPPAIPFILRPFGRGMIVALPDADPFADPTRNWPWLFNTLGADRWQWYRRHGLSLQRENNDYWDFLIAGVGLAPVTQFQVLITLFVVAIGPINYYLLRRWHKLNLLIVTVPACAAAITLCLFLYALMADGLGVRVRTRSITEIDQRRGEAACWARLCYYAGLSPSRGISFPADTVVLPLDDDASGGQYNTRRRPRGIDWDTEQNLSTGWLPSRKPTQLVTVRSRKTEHKLVVTETAGSPPKVENQLGSNLNDLVLVDSQGQCFGIASLAAGQTATLSPLEPAKAASQLHSVYSKQALMRPPGMDPTYSRGMFGFNRRNYYYWMQNTGDLATPSQTSSVLERTLTNLVESTPGTMAAQASPNPEEGVDPKKPGPAPLGPVGGAPLRPRSYLVTIERSPEVTYGVESFNEEDSLHVIIGRW